MTQRSEHYWTTNRKTQHRPQDSFSYPICNRSPTNHRPTNGNRQLIFVFSVSLCRKQGNRLKVHHSVFGGLRGHGCKTRIGIHKWARLSPQPQEKELQRLAKKDTKTQKGSRLYRKTSVARTRQGIWVYLRALKEATTNKRKRQENALL